jgi:hypothetical protein
VFKPESADAATAPDGSATTSQTFAATVPGNLLDKRGSIGLWFKSDKEIRSKRDNLPLIHGDAIETFISPRGGNAWILLHTGPAMTNPPEERPKSFYWFGAAVTHLKADRWYHAVWTWDTDRADRNAFYLDGRWQADGEAFAFPGLFKPAGKEITMQIGSEGLTVSSLSVYPKPIAPNQLAYLHERIGHRGYSNEGVRFPGNRPVLDDVDWVKPLYETSFDDQSVLDDWQLEGGSRVSIADGNLLLESNRESIRSEAKANHLVCWLKREMPADFLIEFTVRPEDRNRGLNIVFFNARGLNGQSIFDPALAPRTGVFRQYINGDLNNYHISYWSGGRGTANLRKNKGFALTAIGKDLIQTTPPGVFQTVRVYKRGGKIRLMVDDAVALAYDDDGKANGPVHTHSGWIGLRQMGHTQRCEYGRFAVYPLK